MGKARTEKERIEKNIRKEKQLGLGLYILAFFDLVYHLCGITANAIKLIIPNQLIDYYVSRKSTLEQAKELVNPTDAIIVIIFYLVIVASIILILLKKKLGVFMYYGSRLASIVASIFISGFEIWGILCYIIIPIIMYFLIKNKKLLFGIDRM